MSLAEGSKLADPGQIARLLHWKNLERLLVWCHVGADTKNGLWAIYGARQGCAMTNLTDWEYHNVRDFEYLNDLWKNSVSKEVDEHNIYEKIDRVGKDIRTNLSLPMGTLDVETSKFFKKVYKNPSRTTTGTKK